MSARPRVRRAPPQGTLDASWEGLTERELREDAPEINLTLAPVMLRGIHDAVGIALPGRPSLCFLREGGAIACVNDDEALTNKP